MNLVFLSKLIVDIVDWVNLSIEEEVVLEIFHLRWGEWPREVQSQISLLFDVLVFRIVLGLTEALHEGFESCPLPVCSGDKLTANFARQPLGRTNTLEVGSRSVIIDVVSTLYPFALCAQTLMSHLLIDEDATIRITTKTFVLECSLVLLIDERNALIMPHNVRQVGFEQMVLTPVGDIKGSDSEIRLEGIIFRIIQ